jgi:hypothetical protein
MNKLLLAALISLLSIKSALAQSYEITSFHQLITAIKKSDFTYKGKGLVFGYVSAQSCLYSSPEIIVLKNYCGTGSNYPARGYTIISAKHGMVDIYQERVGSKIRRDLIQTEFAQNLSPYLTTPLPLMSLHGLSDLMEKMYEMFNPGCWSTNWSQYTGQAEAECSSAAGDVRGLEEWIMETQDINGDEKKWQALFETIENKLLP